MPWFVALALLVVPIVEIYVIIQIGQVIGGWPTVALLLVECARRLDHQARGPAGLEGAAELVRDRQDARA